MGRSATVKPLEPYHINSRHQRIAGTRLGCLQLLLLLAQPQTIC